MMPLMKAVATTNSLPDFHENKLFFLAEYRAP